MSDKRHSGQRPISRVRSEGSARDPSPTVSADASCLALCPSPPHCSHSHSSDLALSLTLQTLKMLRVAAWQMRSHTSMQTCRASVERGIAAASAAGAALVSFPENALALSCPDARPLTLADLQWVSEAALQHKVAVCLGVIQSAVFPAVLPSNALLWWDAKGLLVADYRKMHLFDHPPSGLVESARIAPGSALSSVECGDGWRCGLSICYDVRFPAMYQQLATTCNLLLIPAAFTVPTGRAHWRTLVVARAIETQCYVVAAAQWGDHSPTRSSWGESLIVDPYGQVVACCPEGEDVLLVHDCSLDLVNQTRQRMPLRAHRVSPWDDV